MELRQRVSPQRDADTVVSLDMGIRTVGLSKLLVPRRADVLRFSLWRLVALETDEKVAVGGMVTSGAKQGAEKGADGAGSLPQWLKRLRKKAGSALRKKARG